MKLENIPGFLITYGAAIIVVLIIALDVINYKKEFTPSYKWIAIALLSSAQVGCLTLLNNFNRAFGSHNSTDILLMAFIIIVILWFIVQIINYRRHKQVTRLTNSNAD